MQTNTHLLCYLWRFDLHKGDLHNVDVHKVEKVEQLKYIADSCSCHGS